VSERPELPYSREVPTPTAWPLVAAFGTALLFAGIVTNLSASVVGLVLLVLGSAGWFRVVFPREECERIEPTGGQIPVRPVPLPPREAPRKRLVLPVEIHPYRAGLFGGIAGGIAMGVVAAAWGVMEHQSPWLPLNLLVGAVNPTLASASEAELAAFNPGWLAIAGGIHLVLSLLTGLLYVVSLPMMPRRPILFGVVVVPVILTSISWSVMGIVNPAMEEYLSWWWFIGSQVAFGAVCGVVVSRFAKVSLMKDLDLATRMGIERSEGGRS